MKELCYVIGLMCLLGAVLFLTQGSTKASRKLEGFPAGYDAGKLGLPPTCNPHGHHYGSADAYAGWMEGWAKGDLERRKQ